MGKLTGTRHGDVAKRLLAFYQDKAHELEEAGQYFMAAVALAFALETAVLAYLLVEFGGELQIPDTVDMMELINAANEIDALSALINIPSHVVGDEDTTDVVDKVGRFRNLIHPARALSESFDPRSFSAEQLNELRDMYESVLHSLMCHL